MKFRYEYRTPDNVRHEDVVSASDREAAFAALKSRGIKPGKLVPAPGFFNNLFGRGKRWMAIVALAIINIVLAVLLVRANGKVKALESELMGNLVTCFPAQEKELPIC